MKIIQIAVTDGELFALSDTGRVFRLVSNLDELKSIVFRWIPLPSIEDPLVTDRPSTNGHVEAPPPEGH